MVLPRRNALLTTSLLLAAIGGSQAVGTTKLQVQIPQTLKKENGYDHRNALFGMLPYGGSIQQQVYYTPNKLCTGSDSLNPNNEIWPTRPDGGGLESPFILMLDRGDCTFVTKVRNAQHFGAAAVLIADDKCQCERENCTPAYSGQMCESVEPMMADDGSGLDIGIPSFLLFKEDADAIKNVIKVQNQVVRVEMSFSVPNPDDRVEYDFWTRPGDVNSYRFFSDFKDLAVALDDRAFFTPHFAIYDGQSAGCHTPDGQNQCMTLCTNHGRYCANDPDDDLYSGVSGADVVAESLRRICIWSHYGADGVGANWWNYVQEFMKRCNEPDYFAAPECIQDAYAHAGIDQNKIDLCMRDSGGLELDTSNNKLDTEIRMQREKGVVLVPTSFVNEAQVRGAMSPANIFEAICSGYSEGTKPDICAKCGTCPHPKECVNSGGICAGASGGVVPMNGGGGKVSTHTFASSMFLLICLFGGAGYWYYNRTREEMREQVRGILAEYMPLEDSEDGAGGGGQGGRFMMQPRSAPPNIPPAHVQQPSDPHAMAFAQQQMQQQQQAQGGGYSAPADPMRSSLMSS